MSTHLTKQSFSVEFLLNVFTEFPEFNDKQYLSLKEFEPAVSSMRDLDATSVPTRHR